MKSQIEECRLMPEAFRRLGWLILGPISLIFFCGTCCSFLNARPGTHTVILSFLLTPVIFYGLIRMWKAKKQTEKATSEKLTKKTIVVGRFQTSISNILLLVYLVIVSISYFPIYRGVEQGLLFRTIDINAFPKAMMRERTFRYWDNVAGERCNIEAETIFETAADFEQIQRWYEDHPGFVELVDEKQVNGLTRYIVFHRVYTINLLCGDRLY